MNKDPHVNSDDHSVTKEELIWWTDRIFLTIMVGLPTAFILFGAARLLFFSISPPEYWDERTSNFETEIWASLTILLAVYLIPIELAVFLTRKFRKGRLIAKYTPPRKSPILLKVIGALLLGTVACGLFPFFIAGGFVGADWLLYPVVFASAALGFFSDFLRRVRSVSLHETGIEIGGKFFFWSQIDEVRYRRFENARQKLEYEWCVQANGHRHRFSMIAPKTYIDERELNLAFKDHVGNFRDVSRII